MTKNNWREEFDMNFLRVGTQILLGIDNKKVGESMATQIKDFIEQVEANAKREAYEVMHQRVKDMAANAIVTESSYQFIDGILHTADRLEEEYLTPPIDDKE